MKMGGIERGKNWKMNPYLATAGGIGLGLGAITAYKAFKNSQILNQIKALETPIQMIPL